MEKANFLLWEDAVFEYKFVNWKKQNAEIVDTFYLTF